MAVIEVNHQTLKEVAQTIEDYCDKQDLEMKNADAAVKEMLKAGSWRGNDSMVFGGMWERVDESGSTAVRFRDALREFAANLNECANEYRKAQEDSYEEAVWLPKYVYW